MPCILNRCVSTAGEFFVEPPSPDHAFHIADLAANNATIEGGLGLEQVPKPNFGRHRRYSVHHMPILTPQW
ncbi:hypothetical protein [Litoreibacter meonggei]|uniref:hypothetical protein n=1 Tax=Litoreibacter meonggei TaxID=1049199 RepID=UPI001474CC04